MSSPRPGQEHDCYKLGVSFGAWFPKQSFARIARYAQSLIPAGGVDSYNPIEAAYKFMQGYQVKNGPFYDEPERSNTLLKPYTMARAMFVFSIADVDTYEPFSPLDWYSGEYKNRSFDTREHADRIKENTAMTTTKKDTEKPLTARERIEQAKAAQAQAAKNDPGAFEENKTGYVNTVSFSGNLGRDVEMQVIPSGSFLAKGSLGVFNPAVKEKEDKKRTKWFEVVMWEEDKNVTDQAAREARDELFANFAEMKSGRKVVVTGRLTWRYWTNRETGQDMETSTITLTDIA